MTEITSEAPDSTQKFNRFPVISWDEVILIVMFVLLAGLYAWLMVKDSVPAWGLISIAALWLLRWVLSGRLSVATPLDLPILALLALLPLNMAISIDPQLTTPKIYAVLLGAAIFYVIVNILRTKTYLRLAAFSLIVLALGVSALGLISADWSQNTYNIFKQIQNLFAPLLTRLPTSFRSAEVNPNLIGGALTFFLPLSVSLFWDRGAFRKTFTPQGKPARLWVGFYKLLLVCTLLVLSFLLLMTLSRGAWLGCAAGLFALLVWKDRRFLWFIPLGILAFFVFYQVKVGGNLRELLVLLDASANTRTLVDRFELWTGAVHLIKDFPLTGTGMDTFLKLSEAYYSFTSFGAVGAYHPHNMLLTVGVELGLPGIVLYAALLGSFGSMVWRLYPKAIPIAKVLLIGLTCGLLAHQVFGLFDAFMLGTKLGLIFWIFLGVVTALFIHREQFSDEADVIHYTDTATVKLKADWQGFKRWLGNFGLGLLGWLAFSAVALSLVNLNVYLSLGLAVLGGVILGVFLTSQFSRKNSSHPSHTEKAY